MRFFPLVFSQFMFILVANLIGMLPFAFTITSTSSSASRWRLSTVTIYGLVNGFGSPC